MKMQNSKMESANERLAIVNSRGELVRTFQLLDDSGSEVSSSSKVAIVYRFDKRVIEPVINEADLLSSGVEFETLKRTTIAGLKKTPYKVGELGKLTLVDVNSLALTPTFELPPEEDQKSLVAAGKWIAGTQAALIILALLLGHFAFQEVKKDETVTTIRTVEIEKLVESKVPTPVLKPMERPLPQRVQRPIVNATVRRDVIKPKTAPRIVTKNAPRIQKLNHKVTANIPRTAPKMENIGALGALGGVSKKIQAGGGLNLNGSSLARGGDRGNGGGGYGAGGQGGVSGALFGKGLIAASNGSGARAGSVGGYGTKGRGGGREGYGNRTMIGSSGGFALPLDGESFIQGGLTREQVEEVINRNMGQIRYCYEKGLQVEPSLKGRVAISFVVGARGSVTSARVQHSSVGSRQLEGCIVGRLKGFRFPRPVAGVNVQVQYPFSFSRVSSVGQTVSQKTGLIGAN